VPRNALHASQGIDLAGRPDRPLDFVKHIAGAWMPSSYFQALMRHHAWAVQRLLDTAAVITPVQLEANTLSHGSLLATLRHVADVDQSWGRAAQGQPIYDVPQMEEQYPDLPALRAFWLAEASRLIDFACSLSPADLDRDIQPPWKKQPYKLWQILIHITNHRAEHGNQIGWQLTALGHSPGDLGFMGFVDLERRGAV
jgi:uncharacterized damage-inducible protein DinB